MIPTECSLFLSSTTPIGSSSQPRGYTLHLLGFAPLRDFSSEINLIGAFAIRNISYCRSVYRLLRVGRPLGVSFLARASYDWIRCFSLFSCSDKALFVSFSFSLSDVWCFWHPLSHTPRLSKVIPVDCLSSGRRNEISFQSGGGSW